MKFALQLTAVALIVAGFSASAQAQAPGNVSGEVNCNPGGSGSWIFQRSYYSHDPVTTVRIAKPQVSGGPYYTRPQGAYVKSGFRNNNIVISVGSAGADVTNVWESWVQTGEQF